MSVFPHNARGSSTRFHHKIIHDILPPGEGYYPKNWVGVCGPLPKTLTRFMIKICDFPYPSYDQICDFPYPINDLFMT